MNTDIRILKDVLTEEQDFIILTNFTIYAYNIWLLLFFCRYELNAKYNYYDILNFFNNG